MLAELLFDPLLIFLFFVAIVGGFVDAVAGGGGLLTIPALLLTQMSPIQAIATNKLQGSFGTFSASIAMLKNKQVNIAQIWPSIIASLVGAILGAIAIQLSPDNVLEFLIPIVIAVIGLYFLFAPKAGEIETKPRASIKSWRYACVPAIGFYDGYVGPGAGMFYTLGGVALRGRDLVSATANAKLLNFTSNFASLIVFIFGGKIIWLAGLVMIFGQIIGGYLGALSVIKGGAKFIRPVIIIICFLMLIKYAFDKNII